ncbi:DsbA family oxidoreductase [Pedobacter montanisoli]|uniref:DsbA family oxidoreductase n=1 Tax=Pedobacter montanisoli TaxID=2923277 RepID=A0ABS9ZSY6_9SPHI|nr:DsbA family oxidoreductase [Pedobacter montanisoli]MCJ0741709.1 DsbA family oxidoreductase [Pedobacter montanisoli]
MKIEIWSDVMCPFCYIGKRHLEKAMDKLPFKDKIDIEWRSYQLNPDYQNENHETVYDYLSRSKGMSVDQAKQMTAQVRNMADEAGLSVDFGKNIPANTFKAHQLIHFAATKKLQNQAEEALFKAHFTEGKDVNDKVILLDIASNLGLDRTEAEEALNKETFAEAVRYDIYESQQIGIRGVPFFVLDRKYALSGAQPVEAFEAALKQSFDEWSKTQQPNLTSLNADDQASCTDEGCSI